MGLSRARDHVRERIDTLPDAVWNCERCDGGDTMQLRRSSLNEQFLADDVGLKCERCSYYATHGIPFEDPELFARETGLRDDRVLDFARDGPADSVAANLEALGYTAAAASEGE